MKNRIPNVAVLFLICLMAACVPARQFEDLQTKEKQCQDDNTKLKADNASLNTQVTEQLAKINDLQKQIRDLSKDSTERGNEMARLENLYDELTKSYDKLLANNEKMLAGNTEETKKLIAELNQTQEDLQKKEDQMKKDEIALDEKQKNLEELKAGLKDREAKVAELQSVLNRKDSLVKDLKKKVTDALLGFTGKGLTVEERNGKVYVSLEDRLLFATGSIVVDKKGEEALKELASVLEKNPDISILVEGHTDDVPITGVLASGAKDNWDLSVLRATSVVKIILKNSSIDPKRLTAAGCGPYIPIDPAKTEEARRKNRRTEIILTPKLDELFKILETN